MALRRRWDRGNTGVVADVATDVVADAVGVIADATGVGAGICAVVCVCVVAFACVVACACVVAFACVVACAPTSPSFIIANNAFALTTVPSVTINFSITPDFGAGTSSITLSVSKSTRFSSRATLSPTFLYHFATTASATDSGNKGTLISMGISLNLVLNYNRSLTLAAHYLLRLLT